MSKSAVYVDTVNFHGQIDYREWLTSGLQQANPMRTIRQMLRLFALLS